MSASSAAPIRHSATTAIHDARPSDTGGIVADLPDPSPKATPDGPEAGRAVERLGELSGDVRGAALLDAAGAPLAATGDPAAWGEAARALVEAADVAAGEPAYHAHVGTEDGEVFLLRERGLVLVAVSDRFVLASLMLCDMRAVLRELGAATGAAGGARAA